MFFKSPCTHMCFCINFIFSVLLVMFNSSLFCGLGAGYLWWFVLAFHFCSGLFAQLILALPPGRWCCMGTQLPYVIDMKFQKVKHNFVTWAWMTVHIPKLTWNLSPKRVCLSFLINKPIFNELQADNAKKHLVRIYYLLLLFSVDFSLQVLPRNCLQKRA